MEGVRTARIVMTDSSGPVKIRKHDEPTGTWEVAQIVGICRTRNYEKAQLPPGVDVFKTCDVFDARPWVRTPGSLDPLMTVGTGCIVDRQPDGFTVPISELYETEIPDVRNPAPHRPCRTLKGPKGER